MSVRVADEITRAIDMFSMNIVRTARHRVVPQCVSKRHFTAPCLRAVGRKQLDGRRSSFLNPNQVQSPRPSTCCLSSSPPPEDGDLVYTGSLARAVRGVKLFSYSTSGASCFLVPHTLLKTGLVVQSFALKAAFCGVIGFFTFLTPVLLHLITKGYVVRLYHRADRDTYTAITYSVFLTEKKSVFHQKQVRIPAVSKMFTSFYADKMGLLVNPDMFRVPHDYNHLMGYDKPFSFDADHINDPDKS
ncbi:transmembrane protein 70, mitochondrial [Pungitius pungitius]|uniref:transmembrane protein 70, mitochondrial n=1 Tax=Pungitius pungitius TaxID=134920 RepID=UPI002E0D52BE